MASTTVNPTVPFPGESERNGYIRIQNLTQWILSLIGRSTGAASTIATNPFTVDANGNVNITNAAGFTLGGAPLASGPANLYKHSDQVLSGGVKAIDNTLTIAMGVGEKWLLQYALYFQRTQGVLPIALKVAASVPFGATYAIGLVRPNGVAMQGGTIQISAAGDFTFWSIQIFIIGGGVAGTAGVLYTTQANSQVTVKALSVMRAAKVS